MNCFKISIHERFRPFSHQPGVRMAIPHSPYAVEIYPARLHFFSLKGEERFTLQWDVKGAIEKFTAVCDLERGVVKVSFFCLQTFYRYLIFFDGKLFIKREKGDLSCSLPEQIAWADALLVRAPLERFSLGCTKQLKIENVRERNSIKEILPLWFMLGQNMDPASKFPDLSSLEQVKNLFKTSTRGLLVPDAGLYQFFGAEKPLGNDLLHGMYLAIRELFFTEKSGALAIHPHLDAGRMTGLRFSLGTVDLEWSKHQLRRVAIHAQKSGKITIVWPKEVIDCRLRPPLSENELPSLDIQEGSHYFFDNFLCR